jgi:hypothetical protein
MLLALLQRPVNEDANTQLNSSQQMSSSAQATSAAAANTRSVTTNTEEHSVMTVTGHTGANGFSVPTADTTSVGETTPPSSSSAGYAAKQNPNDKGIAPMNQPSPALNPEAIGASQEDGNKAAVAASSAEMQTDANGDKTTYRTERKSEADDSGNANPKETEPPSEDVKTETTPTAPQ